MSREAVVYLSTVGPELCTLAMASNQKSGGRRRSALLVGCRRQPSSLEPQAEEAEKNIAPLLEQKPNNVNSKVFTGGANSRGGDRAGSGRPRPSQPVIFKSRAEARPGL